MTSAAGTSVSPIAGSGARELVEPLRKPRVGRGFQRIELVLKSGRFPVGPAIPCMDLSFDPRTARAEHNLELAKFYRAHRAHVCAHLRGFGVPDAAVEDAAHDCFVVAFRRLDDYDPNRGALSAWLIGIAWRVAATHRRRKVWPVVELDDGGIASDMPDPEAYAARSEASHVLERVLRSLPTEQAAAFVMAELEGLSGPEIAEHWGIAQATAYTRIARARAKMRAEVERAHYGRRPWWAIVWWPWDDSLAGPRLTAAFVTVRGLARLILGMILIVAVSWWAVVKRPPKPSDDEVGAPQGSISRSWFEPPTPRGSSEPPTFDVAVQAGSMSGIVRAAAGGPIAHAEVCSWPDTLERAGTLPNCTTSTSDGHFRIAPLIPSRYRVTASANGFVPGEFTNADGEPQSLALLAGEARTGIELVLEPGGFAVRGVVTDVLGGPIESARILLTESNPASVSDGVGRLWGLGAPVHTLTKDDGTFEVWATSGDCVVSARSPGYGEATDNASVPGATVRIAMVPESTIAGIVIDGGSKAPIEGARVVVRTWARAASSERTVATTDDTGRFVATGLVPGRYRLAAIADGQHGEAKASHWLELGASIDDVVIAMVPAATLSARVVVEPGGVECPSGAVNLWDRFGNIATTTSIASNGVVTFDALEPGEYSVLVLCDDHSGAGVPETLTIVPGPNRDVVWTVTRGYAIRGHVRDSEGQGLRSAVAIFASIGEDGTSHLARSDSAGRYIVRGLSPGRYWINPSNHQSEPNVSVTVLDADVEVDLEVPVGLKLVGRVLRGQDPAAQVDVHARPQAGFGMSAVTDDDGRFSFGGLTSGEYSLSATDVLGHRTTTTMVAVEVGTISPDVLLKFPPTVDIRGTVADEDGSPAPDVIVTAMSAHSLSTEAQRTSELLAIPAGASGTAFSGPNGEFTLSGISPDSTYTVVAHRRGGGSVSLAGVAPGSTVKLQIPHTSTLRGNVHSPAGPTALWIELRRLGDATADAEWSPELRTGMIQREPFFLSGGAFEFSGLDAGVYDVRAFAREGRARGRATLVPGATVELSFELDPHRVVHGHFTTLESGTPIPNVCAVFDVRDIEIQSLAARAERALQARIPGLCSDADGRFIALDVPPDAAVLLAISKGFQREPSQVLESIVLLPGATEEIVDFPIATPRLRFDEVPGTLGFTQHFEPFTCVATPKVQSVDDPTIASGLVVGDEIVAIDGYDVSGTRCYLARTLMRVPAGRTIALELARGETVRITARQKTPTGNR